VAWFWLTGPVNADEVKILYAYVEDISLPDVLRYWAERDVFDQPNPLNVPHVLSSAVTHAAMLTVLAFVVRAVGIVTVNGEAGAVKAAVLSATSTPNTFPVSVGRNTSITALVLVPALKSKRGLADQVPL